jgi:hypothetical protein
MHTCVATHDTSPQDSPCWRRSNHAHSTASAVSNSNRQQYVGSLSGSYEFLVHACAVRLLSVICVYAIDRAAILSAGAPVRPVWAYDMLVGDEYLFDLRKHVTRADVVSRHLFSRNRRFRQLVHVLGRQANGAKLPSEGL